MTSAPRRPFTAALAACGGIAAALLGIELVLRVSGVWIGRHSDTLFTLLAHDEALGWRMKPNLSTTADFVDVEGLPVRSNAEGFYDAALSRPGDPSRCRIAFLGDSFTWGLGVREEERFGNRVAAARPAWQSINFGMPGYGVDQSLLVWERVAAPIRPDAAVLTIYQNDYADDIHVVRYGRRKPYYVMAEGGRLELNGVPVPPAVFWDDGIFNALAPPYIELSAHPLERRSRIVQWIAKNSDTARLLYTLSRRGSDSDAAPAKPRPPAAAWQPSRGDLLQMDLLGALVERLGKEVAANGASLLVVLAGTPIPHYARLEESLGAAGIRFIDATTDVLGARLPAGARVYHPLNGHWTAAAHDAVAALIVASIDASSACRPHP